MGDPTALDWSVDGGATWTAASSPTIGSGSFSFAISAGLPNGAYQIKVRDHNATATIGTSGTFVITFTGTSLASNPGSLILFIDASDPTLLWQDTALSVPIFNGAAVQSITDKSGSGNNFTQATAANAPIYQVNQKNGMPGIRFTGSIPDFLQMVASATIASALQSASGYFIHTIFTPATLPSSSQIASDVFMVGASTSNSGTHEIRPAQFRNTGVGYHTRNGGSTNNDTVSGGAAANTLSKQISRWDGATIYNAINALAEATLAFSGTAPSGFNVGLLGCIQASDHALGSFPFDGWLHELRVYTAFGSAQNKSDAQTYATSKWGS
jgi:hypothetical protein